MSSTSPPDPNVDLFNNLYWITDDTPLTQGQADKRYLRYPIAQGKETLQAIDVNGIATFNTTADFNSTANFNSTTTFDGNATFAGTADIIQQSGSQILQQPASTGYVSNGNMLNFTTIRTGNGTSPLPSVEIIDSVSNKTIYILPNAQNNAYDNIVQNGDAVIVSQNNVPLVLTNSNSSGSETNGIRLDPTQVLMGFGGTADTPTSRVVCNSTSVSVNPSLTFPDNSVQSNAYTGAGVFAGSYTEANITIDANGKITAISSGTSTIPANLTPNSVTITPTSGNAAGAGISNPYNTNGRISFSGSGGRNVGNVNAFCAGKYVEFDFNNGGGTTPSGSIMKYRITFTFWNSSAFGETCCLIDFYPNRWTQGVQTGNQLYNINNKINGNGSYVYTNATYAPSGRQYWTYNQSFSGVSGPNALFIPHNGYFDLYFCIPDSSYSFSGCVEALDTTAVSTGSQGITLEVLNT